MIRFKTKNNTEIIQQGEKEIARSFEKLADDLFANATHLQDDKKIEAYQQAIIYYQKAIKYYKKTSSSFDTIDDVVMSITYCYAKLVKTTENKKEKKKYANEIIKLISIRENQIESCKYKNFARFDNFVYLFTYKKILRDITENYDTEFTKEIKFAAQSVVDAYQKLVDEDNLLAQSYVNNYEKEKAIALEFLNSLSNEEEVVRQPISKRRKTQPPAMISIAQLVEENSDNNVVIPDLGNTPSEPQSLFLENTTPSQDILPSHLEETYVDQSKTDFNTKSSKELFFFKKPLTEVNIVNDDKIAKDNFFIGLDKFVRLMSNKLSNTHLSHILREIARTHRKNDDSDNLQLDHKNELSVITRSLYEKSLAIDEENQRSRKELNLFLEVVFKGATVNSKSKDRIEDYKKYCQQIGFYNYFYKAIKEYITGMMELYPNSMKKILAHVSEMMVKKEFIDEIKLNELNAMGIESIFRDTNKLINKHTENIPKL